MLEDQKKGSYELSSMVKRISLGVCNFELCPRCKMKLQEYKDDLILKKKLKSE